jgi:hypothetical protein
MQQRLTSESALETQKELASYHGASYLEMQHGHDTNTLRRLFSCTPALASIGGSRSKF